jgi:hypothetical protein
MGVRQNHRVDVARRDWRVLPVPLAPLFWTLKKSAINEQLKSALPVTVGRSVDEMFGTGDRTGSTEKLDVRQ